LYWYKDKKVEASLVINPEDHLVEVGVPNSKIDTFKYLKSRLAMIY